MREETLRRKAEKFRIDFRSRFGKEWELVTDFCGYNSPVTVRHIPCGKVISMTAARIAKTDPDLYCADCGKAERLQRKAVEYRERFATELGGEWEQLTEFKGTHEPITAVHIPCGELRTAPAKEFFRGGCWTSERAAASRKRFEGKGAELVQRVEVEYNVTSVSEYKSERTPHTWKCNHCGTIIEKTVENILFRKGEHGGGIMCDCRINRYDTRLSDGTLRIIKYLRDHGIPYMREKVFEDCRDIRPLPLDFVLTNAAGEAVGAIEHDGPQHFVPIDNWGGEEQLQRTRHHDKIKTEWCKKNGIPLLRVRFDAHIEQEVEAFLNSI